MSVQEQEERARELEQEVAEVRGERDRELAAATGNWEEAERLLTEEVGMSRDCHVIIRDSCELVT